MDTTTALFYVFSAILLFSAFRVITARSTVHAALYLVLAFFNAACVWMLLRAEFLAIALVLVYVGAVMVLFLFVVMMLDINADETRQSFWKHFPLAGVIGVVIALEMAVVLIGGFRVAEATPMAPELAQLGNTKALGVVLYTQYLYPLEIAAVILLVAIIAAIALTMRRRKDSRWTDPAEQVRVTKAQRLKIVNVPVAAREAAAPEQQQAAPTGGKA